MNFLNELIPKGSFDELLWEWMELLLKVEKEGILYAELSLEHYHSYLPKDDFKKILDISFELIRDRAADEKLNIVLDVLYFDLSKKNLDKLAVAEFFILKYLLYVLLSQDMSDFTLIMTCFASSQMNQKISTKLEKLGY